MLLFRRGVEVMLHREGGIVDRSSWSAASSLTHHRPAVAMRFVAWLQNVTRDGHVIHDSPSATESYASLLSRTLPLQLSSPHSSLRCCYFKYF
jgi:hypothetical protein